MKMDRSDKTTHHLARHLRDAGVSKKKAAIITVIAILTPVIWPIFSGKQEGVQPPDVLGAQQNNITNLYLDNSPMPSSDVQGDLQINLTPKPVTVIREYINELSQWNRDGYSTEESASGIKLCPKTKPGNYTYRTLDYKNPIHVGGQVKFMLPSLVYVNNISDPAEYIAVKKDGRWADVFTIPLDGKKQRINHFFWDEKNEKLADEEEKNLKNPILPTSDVDVSLSIGKGVGQLISYELEVTYLSAIGDNNKIKEVFSYKSNSGTIDPSSKEFFVSIGTPTDVCLQPFKYSITRRSESKP